jgi:hypothetical protein
MRTTPHYTPAQPNTSARTDYYNYNGNTNYAASPDNVARTDYYDDDNNATRASDRSGSHQRRPRLSLSSAQRLNSGARHSSPMPQQQQQQQRLYQQQAARSTAVDQVQPMSNDFSSVVYTVQDTFTDTQAHETDYGGMLTIRTTTVTRTITERLVRSDEDEDSSDDDGEVHLQKQYREGA